MESTGVKKGKVTKTKAEDSAKGKMSKWASLQDWERVRPVIRQLYVEEDRTLKEVMGIMATKYGHRAT